MTPETKIIVRAAVTIDGSNGALLGGRGALTAAPAAGLYQLLLEERIAQSRIVCLATPRGPVARLLCSCDSTVQNLIEVWVVDELGNATNPTELDVVILEVR